MAANDERLVDLIVRALRDWLRGYSDYDLYMADRKMYGPFYPGQITYLTEREFKAFRAHIMKRSNILCEQRREES